MSKPSYFGMNCFCWWSEKIILVIWVGSICKIADKLTLEMGWIGGLGLEHISKGGGPKLGKKDADVRTLSIWKPSDQNKDFLGNLTCWWTVRTSISHCGSFFAETGQKRRHWMAPSARYGRSHRGVASWNHLSQKLGGQSTLREELKTGKCKSLGNFTENSLGNHLNFFSNVGSVEVG